MSYRGRVKNGIVILDEPAALPEGARVRVDLLPADETPSNGQPENLAPGQALMKHAGKAVGLPADTARNLDHYLYGHPKQ